MIRRFNHTSRKSIRGAHARVTLRRLEQNVPRPRRKGADDTSNETWCFDLKLDLDRFGFPADARLRIDAWRGTASQRWDWGTVGTQAAPPERDRILTDVPKTSQFRVSVVAAGDSGRLLGVADKLRPRLPVESLLPLQRADLGDEVWRLDYGQGDDIVVLQVNRDLTNFDQPVHTDPAFRGLVMPQVLRSVLERALLVEHEDPREAQGRWSPWFDLARSFLPDQKLPSVRSDAQDDEIAQADRWIEDVVAAFSSSKVRAMDGYQEVWRSAMKARELTAKGIERARQFLDEARQDPDAHRSPPPELLRGPGFTRSFRGDLVVKRRTLPFASRREVGRYLAPRLRPFRAWIAEQSSFWSWLAMFHFEDTVRIVDGRATLSPLDETFVIDPGDDQNLRGMHRHYLRSAWQLYEVHGNHAAFLLDQPPTARGDIADRILQSQRIFNSVGIVQLILRLYTEGRRNKRGFRDKPGGLRHLLRVLDQFERTYDVYGMSPQAVARILPLEFEPWWTNGAAAASGPPEGSGPEEPAVTGPHESTDDEPSSAAHAPLPDSDKHESRDLELARWEARVRRNGHGTMRYKRFEAAVTVDDATGRLQGRIRSPQAWWIGKATAPNGTEFARALRRHVEDYLARGNR